MARIAREEHAAIRRRVDVEGERVADVAAAYGCTPANIYAILAKERRQTSEGDAVPVATTTVTAACAAPSAPTSTPPTDLFTEPAEQAKADHSPPKGASSAKAQPTGRKSKQAGTTEHTAASSSTATPPDASPPSQSARSGAAPRTAAPKATRTGYALVVRNNDREDAVNPFRSLDELLSAAKPILRNAARSPEPVWFSIQQIDLDALDDMS